MLSMLSMLSNFVVSGLAAGPVGWGTIVADGNPEMAAASAIERQNFEPGGRATPKIGVTAGVMVRCC